MPKHDFMPRVAASRAAALVMGAAMLAGCTLAPHYERPVSPVAAAYPTGAAYRTNGTNAASDAKDAVDLDWHDFFRDPRLQRLIELSLQNNRDLRVAMLNVQASRAQYRIERANLFPTLSATASQTRERTPLDLLANNSAPSTLSTLDQAGASASWELDFFGRLQSLKDAARYQYLASAQAQRAAQILLVSEVANQYLALGAADEQLRITAETLAASQASYDLARTQFKAGISSELDLRQAETVVDQAQADREAQTRVRAQAENALVLLIGAPLPADLPPGLPFDSPNLLADVAAGIPSDLLARRPDIIEAEDTLRAANANIGAARAAFFPSIALTANGGSASTSLAGLFKAGSAAWTFVPSLTMPLFTAGSNLANLDLAHVQKNIAVAQYEKSIQAAFREVADGLAARGTYSAQLDAQQRYTFAYRRTLDLSTARYRAGTDSYLQVLTAQNGLYAAQQNLIVTQLNRLTSLVNLYGDLGGGWRADATAAADAAGEQGVAGGKMTEGGKAASAG